MAFKENLLKKIKIEELSTSVMRTIGAPDSGIKIDRQAMLHLLDFTNFKAEKERDLSLYVRPFDDSKQEILVLDNELALYRSTVADVVLRKSPTVKEMISIRNAIKILNDKDVVLTKRSDTVTRLRDELINGLDLSYTSEDVAGIVEDAAASLDSGYGDGVVEALILLAEMLGYKPAPKVLALNHYVIFGAVDQTTGGTGVFGPMVTYSRIHNRLRWIDRKIDTSSKSSVMECREEIESDAPSDKMGERALLHLSSLLEHTGMKEKQ